MRSASTDPTSTEPTSTDPQGTDPTRAEPASSDAEPAPRRPRITHLVLVDGLPADHWVEESADVRLSPVRSRPGVGTTRRVAALTSETEQRDLELSWLDAVVGGRAALLTLDARPLEPRPLEVPDLGPEPAARARLIGAECDRLAVEVFADEELALVLRRLWEAVLGADPGMLARSTRDDTAVGALVWAAAQANGLLGAGGSLLVRELWSRLGVPASSGSRGSALLDRLAPDAGSLVTPPGAPRLRPTGRSDLLLAATRAQLVTRRDRWLR
jgi:hypothetical protein